MTVGLDPGRAEALDEAVDGRPGHLRELGARCGRERLDVEPVERDDGDGGAGLLGELGRGVGQPRLVRPGLRRHDDAIRAPPSVRT